MPVSVHLSSSFPAAWETLLLPWFKSVATTAFSESEPVAVVTPLAAAATFLRSKLLERGISLLGVKFFTPVQLREMIMQDDDAIPLREHLRLLLSIAAEQSVQSQDPDLAAIVKSVARAPDNLLREIDRVRAAGWSFSDVAPPALHVIAGKFDELVRQCGFQLVHEADRAAIETARTTTPLLSNLLVTGFSGAHWPLWPLLHATALSAQRATVVLEYPREQTRAADEAWIGTWEEFFAPATPLVEERERPHPFADLVRPINATIGLAIRNRPHFVVGFDMNEQARAIAAMAIKFLNEKSCARLGILFARAGALPRLVSQLLARAGIAHNDAIGHVAPGEFETAAWSAWQGLQENHQLDALLRFLDANTDSGGELPVQTVRDKLRLAYRKILIDDIAVLREYCARQTGDAEFTAIAKLLARTRFLPTNATLSRFLAETKTVFAELKWNNRWADLERLSKTWSHALDQEFSRATYLRWLNEIVNSYAIARAPEGEHPYSRVHLMSYAEAEGNQWSHLIVAGLNQGEWPQSESESGFLDDEQIADLNARAIRRGSQGEGHAVARDGKTFLLGVLERRQIALRQFVSALESAEHGLAIAASLHQESAPERVWNPSELFSQIYFATGGTPLSQETMSILQQRTRAWLTDITGSAFGRPDTEISDSENSSRAGRGHNASVAQTRVAYDARRRANISFGEYEFALREPIDRQITLRATEWDKVVKIPALIWMKTYLGVENEESGLNEWSATTGNWVHDWLAQISGTAMQNVFVDLPPADEMRERVAQAARAFRKQIVDLCLACDRTVPDWWHSGWSNGLALADCLASKLREAEGWPCMAAEWNLESPQIISLKRGMELRLRGRIDLVFGQSRPNESQFGRQIWIIDYKTGSTKSLRPTGNAPDARIAAVRRKLVRGDAIQLGLYALAARELGATDIKLSLLSPRTDLERPQLVLVDLEAHSDFWDELHRMQETGIFGLRGPIRSEFSFAADYPLAMLPIDTEFLHEKWSVTHPPFADEEDNRS